MATAATSRRRSSARMAPPPAHEPARPRGRRRDLHPASELRRKRALAAVAGDGVASGRAARGAVARPQSCCWCRRATRRCSRSGRSAIRRSRPARKAIELVLKGHEPLPGARRRPALDAGRREPGALRRCSPAPIRRCSKPPVNVLRLSLHPSGLAPRIANLAEWRAHLLERLRKQIEVSADPVLVALLDELRALPGAEPSAASAAGHQSRLRRRGGAAAARDRGRRPVVPEHDDGVRHPGRRHAVGDRARSPSSRPIGHRRRASAALSTGLATALRRQDRCAIDLRQPKTGPRFA